MESKIETQHVQKFGLMMISWMYDYVPFFHEKR